MTSLRVTRSTVRLLPDRSRVIVYACGSLIHRDQLVIPYRFSDRGTAFATVSLDALLEHLT